MKNMKKTLCLITITAALAGNALADSLWKDDISRGVTADKKARLVGDILNVRVQESNTAKRDSKTTTERKGESDASISSFLFGTTTAGSGMLKSHGRYPAMKFANTTKHEGVGKIDNSDSITSRFSVRVIDVLPNGNLIVQGTRQASYAGETQTIILRGAVRPFDIEQDNTIYSYLLSDLNIRYLSNGTITKAKDKGWFMNIWDAISPF